MQSSIKELELTRFSDSMSTCTKCDISYNFVVTKFCGLDVSLCFNVFDSNVGRTPTEFNTGTLEYTSQKHNENNSKHAIKNGADSVKRVGMPDFMLFFHC